MNAIAGGPLLYEGQFPQAYLPLRGFATRDRYGPSILDQAGRCMRSWGLRYLCGFDSQEPEWSDIADHAWDGASRTWRGIIAATGAYQPVPSRKRSTALGTESHRIAGAFYEGLPSVPGYKTWAEAWASFPGQVAQAWLDVMPRPDECDQVFSELPVALYPDPDGEELPGGLVIEGTSDLLLQIRPDAGSTRFNESMVNFLFESDQWVSCDFKTSRDWRYQKTSAQLFEDKQGVIYPLASMRRLDLDALPGRWAYSITDVRKRREARATDFVQTREHAEAAVAGYFREAGVLKGHYRAFTAIKAGGSATSDVALADRLAYAQALPGDTTKCDDFGGCPHSWERGGACMARRDLGSRLQGAAKAQAPSLESALEASLAAGTCAATPTRVYTQDNQIMPASALARSKSMSPWKKAAERFKAEQAAAKAAPARDADTGEVLTPNPAAPVAVAESATVLSAPMLGQPQTVLAEVGLAAEPVQPAAAEAPKRTRGRPPGAKNKPKAPDANLEEFLAASTFCAGSAESSVEAAVDAINANLEAFCAGVRPPFTEAGVAELREGGIISEAAARSLLNGPPPNGVSPAAAQAMVNALVDPGVDDPAALETASEQAGAHAANSLRAIESEPRPIHYSLNYSHYQDPYGKDGTLSVQVTIPRHRVAAAAEAIDAFVAAVFPSATPGAVP